MSYTSSTLIFSADKITVSSSGYEVMMDWEHPIMSASAAYVTQNGGDILEVGFGMGIASGYIQSHSISSHTIIENHPQIISKSIEWASGKSNVTIISQSWYDVLDSLGTYDGIFNDTFADEDDAYFSASLSSLVKSGTKVTFFWANDGDILNVVDTQIKIDSFREINIRQDDNSYFPSSSVYFMPEVEF